MDALVLSASRIAAIAHNTVREAVRSKVLYTLLFFALAMIAAGVLLASLSYVERERILQDIGLGAVRFFSSMIAIFVGIGLLHKEVDRRTIFTILSKPIGRGEFLIGKFFGLVATLWLQIAVMAVCFALISALAAAPITATHAAAFALIGLEAAIVVALAVFFSAFTTPMLAAFFTGGTVLISYATRDLRALGDASGVGSIQAMTEALYRTFPDLEAFDLSVHATHALPIAGSDVLLPLAYAAGYVILLLLAATWMFERRDFR